jgi:hypothetical protein
MQVETMLIPNLVWRAGRSSLAVRTAALAALWTLLNTKLLAGDQVGWKWFGVYRSRIVTFCFFGTAVDRGAQRFYYACTRMSGR